MIQIYLTQYADKNETTQVATVYCEVISCLFGKLCLSYNTQTLSKERDKTNLLLSNIYANYRWNIFFVSLANSVPSGSKLERKRKVIEPLDIPKINCFLGKPELLKSAYYYCKLSDMPFLFHKQLTLSTKVSLCSNLSTVGNTELFDKY